MTNDPELMENIIPLWLDCDPGTAKRFLACHLVKDAFAILLAAQHPRLHLLGVSTVHGNASLEKTAVNAGRVLTAIGRPEVPVYPGASRPFCRKAIHAPNIHGASGLDGTDLLPDAASAHITDSNAVTTMRDAVLAQPEGTAWVVATGALTNIALLFAMFPEVTAHIKGLSIMGGAIGGGFSDAPLGHLKGGGQKIGNVTRWAEFNIYCDPEAAQSIFSNPMLAAKTTLIPLDLTHQVIATEEVLEQVMHLGDFEVKLTLREMLHDLLSFFRDTYASVFGFSSGPPLHDPIAVAVLLIDEPHERLDFDDGGGERWHVDVVTSGLHSDRDDERWQLGRTTASKAAADEGGVRIPRKLDVKRFWMVLEECIQRAEILLAKKHQGFDAQST